jgi:capsular exopolysaccharide synthesis family protein
VVGNLWCIPAGSLPPNPADLLHSVRLRSTVEELRASFDCVIFDTPPVGAVTDAAVLSTLVDGCLFVVRANKTARGVTRRGLASLRDIDARVLGAVLNSVDIRKGSYAYYYQSKYYGEAASTREPPGSPPAGPPGGGASPSGPAPSGTQPMRPGAAAAV